MRQKFSGRREMENELEILRSDQETSNYQLNEELERLRREHERKVNQLKTDHASKINVLQGHIRGKQTEIQSSENQIDGVRARLRDLEGQLDDSLQVNRMLTGEIDMLKSKADETAVSKDNSAEVVSALLKNQKQEFEVLL